MGKGYKAGIYMDPQTRETLQLLVDLWYEKGLLEKASMSDAIRYMVANFSKMPKAPQIEDGSLPVDRVHRRKLDFLASVIKAARGKETVMDLEVFQLAIDYLYPIFGDEEFLDRFLKAKGELRDAE